MTQQNQHTSSITEDIETDLLDHQGTPVMRSVYKSSVTYHPHGSVTKKKRSQKRPLVCGTMWPPSSSMPLAICDHCRNPPWTWPKRQRPDTGAHDANKGHACCRCAARLCPKHARRCSDQQWRCVRCARIYRLRSLLLHIFCTRG